MIGAESKVCASSAFEAGSWLDAMTLFPESNLENCQNRQAASHCLSSTGRASNPTNGLRPKVEPDCTNLLVDVTLASLERTRQGMLPLAGDRHIARVCNIATGRTIMLM